ncbi:MAG: putative membrane-bound dehydrogenase-like protein [Myxococcota bacterium]
MADRHEIFLSGFGGPNHDHGLHSFVHGPAGDMYFAAGNAGPHIVTDAAGWHLRSGSVYVGGGEVTADNRPGLLSDDGKAWTAGLALRIGADGRGLGVVAHNFRNNYEVAIDSFGNLFVSDNDDDGNRSCRTLWTMEGANYGYFSKDGSRYWQADRQPGQTIPSAHWHQNDPGVAPAGTINGAGGPTGVCVYEGEWMAPWIEGAVLNADAGAGIVYAHSPRLEGAGYVLDAGWLIRGSHTSESRSADWFRPSDVCVATDGSVYVADWYDPGVGGHAAGDAEAYGRILRIAPESSTPVSSKTAGLAAEWEPFFNPAPSARTLWRASQADRRDELAAAVLGALEQPIGTRKKSQVLFYLSSFGQEHEVTLRSFLSAPEAELRLTALRALRHAGVPLLPILAVLSEDKSPAVRREVLILLQHLQEATQYPELMVHLAGGYDGQDRQYLEAFGLAAAGHEEELYGLLVAELGDTPSRWTDRFAGLAWRLHPLSAVDSFVARAADTTLAISKREQALDALAFIPERPAAEAMANLALIGGDEIGARAAWWIRQRDTNDWRAYDLARELQVGDFARAELLWESGVMRAGKRELQLDITGAKRLWLVVDDGGNGNSCDWADWIEPTFETPRGSLRLTDVGWINASADWGQVRDSKNVAGGPLKLEGEAASWGIGTHAKSSIELIVPVGATKLHAWVGPDEGGTKQSSGTTSIEFKVYVERPKDRTQFMASEKTLLDQKSDPEKLAVAIRALATDAEGGLLLIRAAREGKLTAQSMSVAAESIFSNPDISVRALASDVFERPGSAAGALPPVSEILALAGDASHGRRLFQDPQMLCSTCHSYDGLGREIGPDLTAIHAKYGRAELLDSILNPSAGIAFGYDSWVFEVDGQGWLSGFVLADGENIVLKDTSGLRHVIAREDVLYRERQSLSVMPTGLAMGLGPQGFADLLAFLTEVPGGTPEFGTREVLFDGTDMSAWSYHLNDPAKSQSDVWSIEEGGVLRCKGSPAGYIYTKQEYENFELELDWRFDPQLGAGNSGVLLRVVGEHKVWPKSIEAQLQSGSAGDIWNIDEVVMLVDPGRTRGRRTQKRAPSSEKPLGEWNHYRILMDAGKLELHVNGVLQNEARWCEELAGHIALQSEGAEIQFRNVSVRPVIGHSH